MTERRAITVRGIVQGVGFRPYVYALASRLRLQGSVRNLTGAVAIEVEGAAGPLDEFLTQLVAEPPPLARIEGVSWERLAVTGAESFRIDGSVRDLPQETDVFIAPDTAPCDACLTELFDPRDRRYRYPFLNCTRCGPRLTVVTGAPYDRERTTLASFPMCAACRAEYEDPGDRRFHAQPTACPNCGPGLRLLGARGDRMRGGDPVARFAEALREGKIGALQGAGGFHLAGDATDPCAVETLRRRKRRDEKPFAVMVGDLDAAMDLCVVGELERELLACQRAPIVLLERRPGGHQVADPVAPGNPRLGVMLPSTPLHHVLFRHVSAPLVMTSGNSSDEPIAYEERDALERLRGVADVFLVHDRPIALRCDDSVMRVVGEREQPVRRSRGYAPEPVTLPLACPCPTLAVGGQLKSTFALGRGRLAFLSHHLGDLDYLDARLAFERDLSLYERLFEIRPRRVVHDLHPDYASTGLALERAAREGLETVAVQHHHAHMASCMAEHGLEGPVIGVVLDGSGLGTDGAIWGGEVLVGGYGSFRRVAHLRYVPLPGGDRAVREPWRVALAHLLDSGEDVAPIEARVGRSAVRTVAKMVEQGLHAPLTSSAGRLFDAVAALAGVRDRVSYEGQAPCELEWQAESAGANGDSGGAYPFELSREEGADETGSSVIVVDTRPILRAIARDVRSGVDAPRIAWRFHATLVEALVAVCVEVRKTFRLSEVVSSGGVFQNALLARDLTARLESEGFRVHGHRVVPPNDGGLSLGQLAVAAACPVGRDCRGSGSGSANGNGNGKAVRNVGER